MIAHAVAAVLVPCFFIGVAGSLVVVAITIVHDLREVLSTDDTVPPPDATPGKG